jgi:hypothetical protein
MRSTMATLSISSTLPALRPSGKTNLRLMRDYAYGYRR